MFRLGAQFTSGIYFSCLFFCLSIFSPLDAQSRTFKNAYIAFEMQDNWTCKLEQTEWVCRAEDAQEAKEAVIILTAKEKGPTDSFSIYENHLNSSINTVTKMGSTLTSIVKYKAQRQKINDQDWLDGLHQDSEVKNYFTRYLATVKDQIAILVTFSAHNRFYSKHSPNFDKTIRSLRVIATKDLLSRPDLGPIRGSSDSLGTGIGQAMPADLLAAEDGGLDGDGQKGLLQNEMLLGLLLFILAIGGYVGFRIYQKRKM